MIFQVINEPNGENVSRSKFIILQFKNRQMHLFFNFSEDIPPEFFSEENQQPYEVCSVCGNSFGFGHYFIEKAFQKTHDHSQFQLTFEYAICESCKNDMMRAISKESMKRIQQFALEIGGTTSFQNADTIEIDLNYLMKHCVATGKSIEELNEYHLVGIFKDGKLAQLPIVYGESFIDEYAELLSEETKGFFDDFFNHITVLPPSLAKLLDDETPKKRPVLI